MSSLFSNILRVKRQYRLNIDLLGDIGALGIDNADSLVSSLSMEGEINAK